MEAMRLFAVWKNIPTNIATGNRNGPLQLPLRRSQSIETNALLFVVDIPELTSQEEVKTRVFSYVGVSPNFEGETIESGLYEEWPLDIRNQFRDPESEVRKLLWATI